MVRVRVRVRVRAAALTSSIVGVSAHLHRSRGQSCVAQRITQYSSVASSRTALQVLGSRVSRVRVRGRVRVRVEGAGLQVLG